MFALLTAPNELALAWICRLKSKEMKFPLDLWEPINRYTQAQNVKWAQAKNKSFKWVIGYAQQQDTCMWRKRERNNSLNQPVSRFTQKPFCLVRQNKASKRNGEKSNLYLVFLFKFKSEKKEQTRRGRERNKKHKHTKLLINNYAFFRFLSFLGSFFQAIQVSSFIHFFDVAAAKHE